MKNRGGRRDHHSPEATPLPLRKTPPGWRSHRWLYFRIYRWPDRSYWLCARSWPENWPFGQLSDQPRRRSGAWGDRASYTRLLYTPTIEDWRLVPCGGQIGASSPWEQSAMGNGDTRISFRPVGERFFKRPKTLACANG